MSYNGAILQSIVTRAVGIHQQLQEVCWLAVKEGQCSGKCVGWQLVRDRLTLSVLFFLDSMSFMALVARNSMLLPVGDHLKMARITGRRKLNLTAMGKEKNIDGDNRASFSPSALYFIQSLLMAITFPDSPGWSVS